MLADDEAYAAKAAAVSDATLDVAEYVTRVCAERAVILDKALDVDQVAWHAPCTLQHGQRITGLVEEVLRLAGYELVPVKDSHLCCGSAGTYSALQPEMAGELARRKVAALESHGPDVIATANVGCQTHLANNSSVPVVHWIELLK